MRVSRGIRRVWGPSDLVVLAGTLVFVLVVVFAPSSVLRLPLAALACLWAPGVGIVAAVYPKRMRALSGLERHALAVAAGILLLPLVVIVLSLAKRLDVFHLMAVLSIWNVVHVFALGWREDPEPIIRGPVPAPWIVGALLVAMLLVVAGVNAMPQRGVEQAPFAMAFEGLTPTGQYAKLNASEEVTIALLGGDQPRSGKLDVLYFPATGGVIQVLLVEMDVAAGAHERVTVAIPESASGEGTLRASWKGDVSRHLILHVLVPEPEVAE